MNARKLLNKKRMRRAARNRAKIFGTALRPRLSVFRSNKFTYAQLINDEASRTLVSASSREVKDGKKSKAELARLVGKLLAERAEKLGIKSAVFDRGAYKYHGRVRALAEGARSGGLRV